MAHVVPLPLRLVDPDWATRVPSPANDALAPEDRRAYLTANPDSFLAVTRSLEDLDPAHPLTQSELLDAAKAALDRLVALGAFGEPHPARFFVYQLDTGERRQSGIVCGVATTDYAHGVVRPHEQVHHHRATHLERHLAAVAAQSSPIAVAFEPIDAVGDVIAAAMQHAPLVDVESEPGFFQRVWAVSDDASAALTEAFAAVPLYLIDGHHRAAAAVEHRHLVGPGPADIALTVAFPTDELTNHAFHRLLPTTLGNYGSTLDALAPTRPLADADGPIGPDEVAVFDGSTSLWHAVRAPRVEGLAPSLCDLATSRLAFRLDLAFDVDWHDAIRYRPGVIPLDRLVAEASAHGDLLFVLPAIGLDELIAVADDELTMPPKSTYFDPKVRSGVFLRHL